MLVIEAFRLRSLRNVHRVFERERVDLEEFADAPQHPLVAEALHVNPGDAGAGAVGRETVDVSDLRLGEVVNRVVDDPDDRRYRFRRGDERARHRADGGPAPVEIEQPGRSGQQRPERDRRPRHPRVGPPRAGKAFAQTRSRTSSTKS